MSLADHVLVLDRAFPTPYREHDERDSEGRHTFRTKDGQEFATATGDLDHKGGQRFETTSYACSCGESLTPSLSTLPKAWAEHVGNQALAHHAVEHIRGEELVVVRCRCGSTFYAEDEDPTDPGSALRGWAEHAEAQG